MIGLVGAYLFGNMLLPLLRRLRLVKDGSTPEAPNERLTDSGGTALCIGTVFASAAGIIMLRFFSDGIIYDTRTDPLFFVSEILIILGTTAGFYADILDGNGKKGGFSRPAYVLTECFVYAVFLAVKYYTDRSTEIYIPLKNSVNLGIMYYPICFALMMIIGESTANLAKTAGSVPSVLSVFFLGAMTVFSHIRSNEASVLCAALAGASMGIIMLNTPKLVLSEGNSGKLFFGISAAVVAVNSENLIFMIIMFFPAFIDGIIYLLKKTPLISSKEKIITPAYRSEKNLKYLLSGIFFVLISLLFFFKSGNK